ncbi:metallophosphoesterase family protein [Oceanobacillus halotolerans]|uniref:hypothetical protein n=1 Tax=Oceanobacillus halotolerans TaxID=2663380 RepID=UPI0013DD4C6B|nr:hypothetical protein [Oceanobacillus halotolerans]
MQLPTLLTGPILRRVEPTNIYIWIATSEFFQIEAALYHVKTNSDTKEYVQLETKTKTETMQSGENLYIHLINVVPVKGLFPTDVLLGYNLYFSNYMETVDLDNYQLLSPDNPYSIVYHDFKYPTFYINEQEQQTILYGSCRKPHGKGDDSFTSADLTIRQHANNLKDRPSYLFLMGDQIYADDVADPIFYFISKWSDQLAGSKSEKLHHIDKRLTKKPFKHGIRQIHGRQYISDEFCQFTSNHAANHLMTFHEFATMYLLTWSPSIWEANLENNAFPTFEDLMEEDAYYFIYPNQKHYEKDRKKERKQHYKRYEEEKREVTHFLRVLPLVRRVLANTPTYMIFDDHDVTDDWNISSDWKERVYDSPLGRHIIANGLTAYWLFQGWGNDPETFEKPFIHTIARYSETFSVESTIYEEWIDRLWHFNRWSFVAPTYPSSLFLDTRTMRSFELKPQPVRIGNIIDEGKHTAQLISEEGWKIINQTVTRSHWTKGDPLIIISPTPLYGIGITESFLYRYVYPFRILGIPIQYDLDFEAWKYNGKGFNQFLQQLTEWNPANCFILSGDVHYANAVQSNVSFQNKKQLTINQFTSSPIHNMSFSGIWGLLLKIMVWFNSLKRKNRTLFRCCDTHNNLINHDGRHQQDMKWYEEINYQMNSRGSIMETDNNIGLLSIQQSYVTNKLLQYRNNQKQEVTYDSISLSD